MRARLTDESENGRFCCCQVWLRTRWTRCRVWERCVNMLLLSIRRCYTVIRIIHPQGRMDPFACLARLSTPCGAISEKHHVMPRHIECLDLCNLLMFLEENAHHTAVCRTNPWSSRAPDGSEYLRASVLFLHHPHLVFCRIEQLQAV